MKKTPKYTILANSQKVANSPTEVDMTISTKCPRKWAFVDMETGNIWVHKTRYKHWKVDGIFKEADYKALKAIRNIIWDKLG